MMCVECVRGITPPVESFRENMWSSLSLTVRRAENLKRMTCDIGDWLKVQKISFTLMFQIISISKILL
jgi:hypothetical protein